MWTPFKPPERTNRFQKTLNREADEKFERIMRERGQWPADRSYPFFREPPVYVVLLETAPGGSCEFAFERTPDCEAIVCFLSPVDAAIEGMLRAKTGLRYDVRPASRIPERYFLTGDGNLMLMLHLSWAALDGRLLFRASGIPIRLWRRCSRMHRRGCPCFEVDTFSLDEADHLYESAGLFAWEETHRRFAWSATEAARSALRTGWPMQKPQGLDSSRCELALYDPDGGRWHFVPQEVSEEP
jgi:hypothetical protein